MKACLPQPHQGVSPQRLAEACHQVTLLTTTVIMAANMVRTLRTYHLRLVEHTCPLRYRMRPLWWAGKSVHPTHLLLQHGPLLHTPGICQAVETHNHMPRLMHTLLDTLLPHTLPQHRTHPQRTPPQLLIPAVQHMQRPQHMHPGERIRHPA